MLCAALTPREEGRQGPPVAGGQVSAVVPHTIGFTLEMEIQNQFSFFHKFLFWILDMFLCKRNKRVRLYSFFPLIFFVFLFFGCSVVYGVPGWEMRSELQRCPKWQLQQRWMDPKPTVPGIKSGS